MLEMINSVFPNSALIACSYRCGSDTTLVTMVVWRRLSIYEWI